MNKATIEERQANQGEYFSNDDLFMLFKFDKNAKESETQWILEE